MMPLKGGASVLTNARSISVAEFIEAFNNAWRPRHGSRRHRPPIGKESRLSFR